MRASTLLFYIALLILLAACGTSQDDILTATSNLKAELTLVPSQITLPTYTAYPTYTQYPTHTPYPTIKVTSTPRPPTKTPKPSLTHTPSFALISKTIGPIRDTIGDESFTMEITLSDVKWSKSESYKEPKPGNIYVTVYITAINQGPDVVRYFGRSDLEVLDSNGLIHDYELLSSTMDTCLIESVDIMPGGKLEGCVSFEVPNEGRIELIYAPYRYEGLKPGRYLSFIIRE